MDGFYCNVSFECQHFPMYSLLKVGIHTEDLLSPVILTEVRVSSRSVLTIVSNCSMCWNCSVCYIHCQGLMCQNQSLQCILKRLSTKQPGSSQVFRASQHAVRHCRRYPRRSSYRFSQHATTPPYRHRGRPSTRGGILCGICPGAPTGDVASTAWTGRLPCAAAGGVLVGGLLPGGTVSAHGLHCTCVMASGCVV